MKSIITSDKANQPYGFVQLDANANIPGNVIASYAATASYALSGGSIDTSSLATTGSNLFIGVQAISGSNGILLYGDVLNPEYPTLADIHAYNANPWLERFYNDTYSTSSAIMAYFGWDDGRFVFHNESTESIGIQVNGYYGENGLLVYEDKVAFVNNIEVTGSIYLGSGSIISESGSTTVITPSGALPGQSLVIRPTAPNLISDHPSGFSSGDTITITFSPSGGTVTGTGSYTFTGCTEVQLGTSLTGSFFFDNEVNQSLTWTVPILSDITGFTFEIYNFATFVSNSISLSSSGSSEHSHIHLISGDPTTVDIYLGDDDQYIKIEKNAGNVVIGTNLDTNQWIFDTSGSLTTPGSVNISGSLTLNGVTGDLRPYKVYTALLTQAGGDNSQYQQSGELIIGVTYYIDDNASNPDFTNVGAPNNNVGTYFVATGTTPNSWGEAGLSYNTGAPVVTVLENTIGNVWFEYLFDGQYSARSLSLFTTNKTTTMIGGAAEGVNNGVFADSVYSASDWIYINTVVFNGSGFSGLNGELFKTPIEIRVYN